MTVEELGKMRGINGEKKLMGSTSKGYTLCNKQGIKICQVLEDLHP
jgi:hypothetical protein